MQPGSHHHPYLVSSKFSEISVPLIKPLQPSPFISRIILEQDYAIIYTNISLHKRHSNTTMKNLKGDATFYCVNCIDTVNSFISRSSLIKISNILNIYLFFRVLVLKSWLFLVSMSMFCIILEQQVQFQIESFS